MSIRTAILALAPTVYWELADASGPAASDSSGNGHPGFFLANFVLQQPGPEAGTFGMVGLLANAGVNIAGSNPLAGAISLTQSVWFALATASLGDNVLTYNGQSDTTGEGVLIGALDAIRVIRGGLEIVGAGGSPKLGTWHQLVHVFVPSGNRITYLDNVQLSSFASGVPNLVLSTNNLLAQTPAPGLLAHAAFWNSALTAAQVNSMWTAGPGANVAADITALITPTAQLPAGQLSIIDSILAFVAKDLRNAP